MKLLSPLVNRATVPPKWDAKGKADYLKQIYTASPSSGRLFSNESGVSHGAVYTDGHRWPGPVDRVRQRGEPVARARFRRQREFAVRMAIGAGRARIVRQLLTESLLLALFGAAGGFLMALAGSRLLVRLISTASNPLEIDVSPDLRVLGFTVAATLLTALLFGLAPALRATRVELEQALKEHARSAVPGASRFNLGKALITGQVALSLVLLVGAGLFLGTLRNLLTIDAGFDRQGVLIVNVDTQQSGIAPAQRVRTYGEILARIRAVPGVISAASSGIVPITHSSWTEAVHAEGLANASDQELEAYANRISPDFFRTLRTPFLCGRDFTEHDDAHAPDVVIINESAARHYFGTVNVLGKALELQRLPGEKGAGPYAVVGVVKDAKYVSVDEKPLRRFTCRPRKIPSPGRMSI